MSPQDMWDHVSDLSELGDWLVMHEGWRSELPDEIGRRHSKSSASHAPRACAIG